MNKVFDLCCFRAQGARSAPMWITFPSMWIILVSLILVTCKAPAQASGVPAIETPDSPAETQERQVAPAVASGNSVGRFKVTNVDSTLLMLDTETGDSWILVQTNSGLRPAAWIPVIRYDEMEDVPEGFRRAETIPSVPLPIRVAERRQNELHRERGRLVIEMEDLLSQLGDQHPRILSLETQIAAIEHAIGWEKAELLAYIDEKIDALRKELDAELRVKGPDHPAVQEIGEQMSFWEEYQSLERRRDRLDDGQGTARQDGDLDDADGGRP